MKLTSSDLKRGRNSLILIIITTIIGFLLFWYFQPVCKPCIPGEYCPPCRSQEQYRVIGVISFIDILLIFRALYFITHNDQDNSAHQ